MIHRVTFVTQLGIPIIRPEVVGPWYGRLALRIEIRNNFFIRGGLKIPDGVKVDWIDWGLEFYPNEAPTYRQHHYRVIPVVISSNYPLY